MTTIQPTHKKNTLLKNAHGNATSNFFKRVFFSATQEEFFATPILFYFFSPTHGHSREPNLTASNVNRFGQSVCELDKTPLRTDRRASGNMGLKEMAGEVLNQTFVLSIYICGGLTVGASNPPLL